MFQFFQLTASEKRTYAAGYGSGYIGSCTFEFVRAYLCFYLFEFLLGKAYLLLLVSFGFLYTLQFGFLFFYDEIVRSKCSLPVTAFACPRSIRSILEAKVCMAAISSSLSFLLFPVSWFIQSKTIWA